VARGKVELSLGPVRVVELVRQVIDDRRLQFEARALDLQLCEDDLWVRADRARMVQILDNLLSNALKFTVAGGHITVEVRRLERRGAIRVSDDGIGFEPELLPRIFEPFRQGRGAKAHSQGLGLGLALVKGLVDLHGFELTVHSAGPARGAWFEIRFPVEEAPESLPPPSRVDSRQLELLLVEDNADIGETLAELLTASGHRVRLASSAEDALERLRHERPDVVLCDIGLPGMDGLEFARSVRADPELHGLKLVAMTGYGDASARSRIESAGFDRHLIKPVRLDALRECLARVAVQAHAVQT
jgi:two-component system CheB/CheR fusion protein